MLYFVPTPPSDRKERRLGEGLNTSWEECTRGPGEMAPWGRMCFDSLQPHTVRQSSTHLCIQGMVGARDWLVLRVFRPASLANP